MRLKSAEPGSHVTYDGNTGFYASYLRKGIGGISCNEGTLGISGNGEKLPCVSIDNIAGLPASYGASIIPRKFNGSYCIDFVLYTPGEEKDRFTPNGEGPKRADVKFGNDTRVSIYDILRKEEVMQNLTLMSLPIKKGRWAIVNEEEVTERREMVRDRYLNNLHNLWMYYTSSFGGKKNNPSFVVHVPQDPYEAVTRIKGWLGDFKRL